MSSIQQTTSDHHGDDTSHADDTHSDDDDDAEICVDETDDVMETALPISSQLQSGKSLFYFMNFLISK